MTVVKTPYGLTTEYVLTHKCGCSYKHISMGKMLQRDYKNSLRWAKLSSCANCERKEAAQ